MNDVPEARVRPPSFGPGRALGWLFVVGLLAAGLIVGALLVRLLAPPPEALPVAEVERATPSVVSAVRDLARLETASYHVERVIDRRRRSKALFGLLDQEDALLLVAAADVTAGVDLTKLRDGDVVVDRERGEAEVLLPPPEVFSARLDNERTYVHTRDTDVFAARDGTLETRVRRDAEAELRRAALEGGLLDRARENARDAVSTLVRALGYAQVEVRFRDAEDAPRLAPEPPPNR
ncbi:MAG: DUF4230 domain-containing protein [Myxococcota bacterium]